MEPRTILDELKHFRELSKECREISAEEIKKRINYGEIHIGLDGRGMGGKIKGDALKALNDALIQGIPVRVEGSFIDGDLDFTQCPLVAVDDMEGLSEALKEELRKRNVTEAPFVEAAVEITRSFIAGRIRGQRVVFPRIIYHGTIFEKEASFFQATFGDRAFFSYAAFGDQADFRRATFGDGVSFEGATFGDRASFEGAIFKGSACFLGGVPRGRKRPPVFLGEADFRGMELQDPENVRFQHVNLPQARFLNTRLDKVQFIYVDWYDRSDGKKALYDEKFVEEEGDYELVARLYRQLKKNYEEQKDYPGAGDFHYGEMEMTLRQYRRAEKWYDWLFALEPRGKGRWRRIQFNTHWFNALLTTSYKRLSGYGEKPGLAIIWAGFILFIPAMVYWLDKLLFAKPSVDIYKFYRAFVDSLTDSFGYMTLRLTEKPGYIWSNSIKLIQAILGPIQIALAALALRRKFRR